jgi:hypothetical protein
MCCKLYAKHVGKVSAGSAEDHLSMTHVFAVTNHKVSVGKSPSTINIVLG